MKSLNGKQLRNVILAVVEEVSLFVCPVLSLPWTSACNHCLRQNPRLPRPRTESVQLNPAKTPLHQSENECRCLAPAVDTETVHESFRKSFCLCENHSVYSGESAAFGEESLLPSCPSCLIRMSALGHGGHSHQVSCAKPILQPGRCL